MTVEFLQTADREFFDAINYYNTQAEGLGFEFANGCEIVHNANCCIWDSVSEVPDAVVLTEEQKSELDRRRDAYHKNPGE